MEINSSFYRLPEKRIFESRRKETPSGFHFAVKACRFMTHMKKLGSPESSAAKFLENVAGLNEKLSVTLFQLPPFWKLNLERLEAFLGYLRGQQVVPGVQVAVEIRNPTWNCQEVHDLFRIYNVALAFADWPDLCVEEPVTADFVYVRRHGPTWLYSSNYSHEQLQELAARLRMWVSEVRDVYVYFNNDAGGYAVANALELMELLRGKG